MGKTLATAARIIIAMVLSRVLVDKADYATYRQTILVFAMAMPFLAMGLSNAMYFFMPNAKSRARGILVENLIMLGLFGSVMMLFLLLGGNQLLAKLLNNPALASTLLLASPLALMRMPTFSASPTLLARERASWAAGYSTLNGLLLLIFVVVAVFWMPTPSAAVTATVLAAAVSLMVALGLMFVACDEGAIRPTWAGARSQLVYGVPLGLSLMVESVSRNIDKVMVSSFSTPEMFANYSNGAIELPLFSVLTGSMMSVLLVDYKRLLDENNPTEIIRLLHRAMLASGTFIFPAMFYLLLLAPEFMASFFGPQYRESATVFRVYLLVLPARTLVFGSVLLAAGKTRTLAVISIVTLIFNTILNYFAIQQFGPLGAAGATVATVYLVGVSIRAVISTQILRCTMADFLPWYDLGKLTIVSVAGLPLVWLALHFTADQHDVIRLGCTLPIYGISTMLVAAKLGFVDFAALQKRVFKRFR